MRGKDLDQVQDELAALAAGTRSAAMFLDEDKAGGGAHFCVVCSRPFVSAAVLADHERTKPHKRQVRLAAEPTYGKAEAEAGAGSSSSYGANGRQEC
jgi:bud site selection protein 20